ncbi:amidohydrolase family protein [Actinomadura sediminis]|uniref:Amidohydrolase family protein n=1 Tax=Actinomadura sediminis TaxID=1038904 RepID=A0ABW3EI67_9ACTN
MTAARTLIRGGHVLTMDPRLGDLPATDVLVDGDTIADVRPGIDAPDADVVDAAGRLVLPGFVDAHRHMWQAVLRGYGADQTLGEYFSTVLGGLGPRLTPDELYLGDLLSALAALDAGITTVQDISNVPKPTPEHSDALVAALRDSGVRAVFAYGHGTAADAGRLRAGELSSGGLVTMALNAEASGDTDVRDGWRLARDLDVPIALHVRGGAPLSRIDRVAGLRPGTVYIHGTGLAPGELRLMADSGGALAVAPAIELTMGHGMPPTGEALAAGLRPALSTDVEVAAAGDMFTQMRAAFQAARFAALHGPSSGGPLPTVRAVLEWATVDGARALGLDGRVGAVRPGMQADLIVLDTSRPGVRPIYDPAGTIVSAMDRADVDTVLVAGRFRKRGGRLAHPGIAGLLERADTVRDRLRALDGGIS